MNITANTEVYCTDGFYGRSTCIILNPATQQITHVAIEQTGLFPHTWLVPISQVIDSTSDWIQLGLSKMEVEKGLLPFFTTESIGSDLPDTLHTTDPMWSRLLTNLETQNFRHENIPLHTLALHSRAVVEARDGAIGHLADFIMSPIDKHITQIVVRVRHGLSHSRLVIPVSNIEHFEHDRIYLGLSKSEAETLASA